MLQLQPEEKKVVDEYIDLIRARFPDRISTITLFGSKARGDSRSESDIDLLIAVDAENRQIKRDLLDLC